MSRPKSTEDEMRAAFERLKSDAPVILSKGTAVNIANVAKEAGKQPAALRCDRYPDLCREIRAYADIRKVTTVKAKPKKSNEGHKRRYQRLAVENDRLLDIVSQLGREVEEQAREIEMLGGSKITKLKRE